MPEEPPASPATRSIELPQELADAVAARIRGSSFESVDAFVTFVLARLIEGASESAFSEDDERRLKERLRSLGYID